MEYRFRESGQDPCVVPNMVALVVTFVVVFALAIIAAPAAQAQSFNVIYNFPDPGGGIAPETGLTIDAAGNFYGTTSMGGVGGDSGTVFKLWRTSAGWDATTLYQFTGGLGGDDGRGPIGRVAIAQDGTLYGSTENGGSYICSGVGCGTVFHLRPSPAAPKSLPPLWNETVLHRFVASDGAFPQGDLTFDPSGNIYGTTLNGGPGVGVVYQLTPSSGGWIETVLSYLPNGAWPTGGVMFDTSGKLYGVFEEGGPHGYGAVYKLSLSGSSWTEQVLYGFTGGDDGWYGSGGVILDGSGNLYGTTMNGGSGGGGTVYRLTPSGDGWIFTLLYSLSGPDYFNCGPQGKLVMDAAGSLYGTTQCDGTFGAGSAFKLTPSARGWTYSSLHDFTNGSDGGRPQSNLVIDADGNLYGTTYEGGTHGAGAVFEITP